MELTVTKIEEYTKSKYKIYLNDEFAFVLYKGELRRYGIEEGMVFTDELRGEIIGTLLVKRAKLRAMHLLEKIDRTEADVRRKLKENLYPKEVIDEAITYVKNYHYIDDERYAENYIRYKQASSSRNEIKRKLMEKGISKEVIATKLEETNDSDTELVKKLILKRCSEPANLNYQEKNKLFAYLYRKGFSSEAIETGFREIIEQD
ncbi:MAG TPA: regulatory protein RecX [Lachnospiraceae bacterium]|nr:regulatory protein RecX [Lachnospiraceae bacterium]